MATDIMATSTTELTLFHSILLTLLTRFALASLIMRTISLRSAQYTVLSKRRLLKLVTSGFVRGWDDPRMPTISGLRRRGYPAAGINAFCDDVGVSRANNLIEFRRLSQHIRVSLR